MVTKKTNVFVDAASLCDEHLSGVGNVVLETIRALSKNADFTRRYTLNLIVVGRDSHMLKRWNLDSKINVKNVPLPTKVWSGLNKFNLVPWADLLFGRGVYVFPNFRNWRLLSSKSITYIHDIAFELFPETVKPNNRAYLLKNVGNWLKRTNKIVTVSEASRQEILEHYTLDPKFVSVVPNAPAQVRKAVGANKILGHLKQEFSLHDTYVLFVGNIEPRKNLGVLIRAFMALPKDTTGRTSLMLVGGGGWLNEDVLELIEEAREQGYSVIHPKRYISADEVSVLYENAQLFAHTSIHEGFGMPVLEALSKGCRVVASDIPVVHEVAGDYVTYVDQNDVNAVTAALRSELSKGRLSELEIEKRKKHASGWGWERSAVQLTKLIGEL